MNKNLSNLGYRMPAEWEKQEAIWITWPYNKKDWPDLFESIPKKVAEIVSIISKTQKMKHKFKDIEKEFYVLTIDNPCGKKDFPIQVNRNYFCSGNDLDKSQVSVLDNKLVIGYLHESRPCLSTDLDYINTHQVTGKFCEFRNNTPLDQLKSGMGDIFIKLAR